MFISYLKIALRNLKRQKMFTIINVTSLAIGMAIFTLATLYSDFNFSYDQFSEDAERIYIPTKITPSGKGGKLHSMFTPIPLSLLMEKQFPEIEAVTRHIPIDKQIVKYNDKKFYEEKVWMVDPNFIDFFGYKIQAGSSNNILENPNSIVLTKPMAIKYFGDVNPVGEILLLDNDSYTVAGVLDKLPLNSSLIFDFLITSNGVTFLENWDTHSTSFIKIKKETSVADLNKKFPSFVENHVSVFKESKQQMYLFPLVDIHLGSLGMNNAFYKSTPVQFYMMMAIAIALLIVVSINFMNLSTARYFNRAKEVGLRKVVGAQRSQLIMQFLGESLLLALIAFPLSLMLYEIMRPAFIAFIGGQMDISLWRNPLLLLGLLGVSSFVGLAAGSYPAFFLSAFRPSQVLKESSMKGKKGARARKFLVVSQFALAMILIVFTMVANKQIEYLLNVNLGYDRDNIVVLSVEGHHIKDKAEPLKHELLSHPAISSVSLSTWYPIDWAPQQAIIPEGELEENAILMSAYPVNYDYFETLNMKLTQGRSFSREFADSNSFLISETAASRLGWEDPIGKTLTMGKQKGQIIGVAKDFHFNHVFMKMAPSVLYLRPQWDNLMFIKTSASSDENIKTYIEEKWKAIVPEIPFESTTLEYHFSDIVHSSLNISKLFNIITIFSIFISCLGLVGLASYTTEQRTKEIGVRKVLGATVDKIVKMLVTDFLKLIVVANIIAFPIAWFLSKSFLEFAWVYKTDIGIMVFVIAIVLSLFSAIISVIAQTVKAAVANPVKALKYE